MECKKMSITVNSYLFVLCFSLSFIMCRSYKILVVFPATGTSHGMLGNACVEVLLEAGHQVTYLSWGPRAINKSHENLTIIEIFLPEPRANKYNINKMMNGEVDLGDTRVLSTDMSNHQMKFVAHERIQKFLRDPNEHFDVAILEWFYGEYIVGIPAVFDCPYIWFSSTETHYAILSLIGEVMNPALVTMTHFKDIPPLTLMQRVKSLKEQMLMYLHREFNIRPAEEKEYQRIVAPLIVKRRTVVPSYQELSYNASLVLGNAHTSVGKAITLPPAYKTIGGFHINENREPLPKIETQELLHARNRFGVGTSPVQLYWFNHLDFSDLMDKSTNGIIYFSLGSMVKSDDLPQEVIEKLLTVFSGLNQTVLWRFQRDTSIRPSNVHTISWAPQQSILAHPHCILFISHGGLLSSFEAVHFGVPLIGIPVFADQFMNIKTLVKRGMAREVILSFDMAEDLKAAIEEVLGNLSYYQAAKHQSFIYHHRTVPPRAELVHWVEHVVQTRGAPFLRSVGLTVPWYQRIYLDVAAIAGSALIVLILVVVKLFPLLKSAIMKQFDTKKYL